MEPPALAAWLLAVVCVAEGGVTFVPSDGAYHPATAAQDAAAGRVIEDASVAGHEYVCGAGKYVQYDHAANSIGCADCPAGMYGEIDDGFVVKGLKGGGVCKFCPAGQSQWRAGQTFCLPISGPPAAPHELGHVDENQALVLNPDKSPGAPKLIPTRDRIITHALHDYSTEQHTTRSQSNWYTKHGQNWYDYEGLQCGCKRCAYDELKHDFVCAGVATNSSTMHGGRVLTTEDKDAKFDKMGKYMPPKDVTYNVRETRECCQQRCVGAGYADCKLGCDLWMHTSSLNYESAKWHPLLRDKCASDCSQGRIWQDSLSKTSSAWAEDGRCKGGCIPKDEALCRLGCDAYLTCMSLVNSKPAATIGAASP